MAELHNERNNANGKRARALKKQAARARRGSAEARHELSAERGHIYLKGEYAPEATSKGHRGPLTRDEILEIGRLRAEGKAQLAIACELDISMGTVQEICKRYNFASPNKAKGGWKNRKGTDGTNAGGNSADERRTRLLADHDAGLCGRDCRLGRHGRAQPRLD